MKPYRVPFRKIKKRFKLKMRRHNNYRRRVARVHSVRRYFQHKIFRSFHLPPLYPMNLMVTFLTLSLHGVGYSFEKVKDSLHIMTGGTAYYTWTLFSDESLGYIVRPKSIIVYGAVAASVTTVAHSIYDLKPYDPYTRQGIKRSPVQEGIYSEFIKNPDMSTVVTQNTTHTSVERIQEQPLQPSAFNFRYASPVQYIKPIELPLYVQNRRGGHAANFGKTRHWSVILGAPGPKTDFFDYVEERNRPEYDRISSYHDSRLSWFRGLDEAPLEAMDRHRHFGGSTSHTLKGIHPTSNLWYDYNPEFDEEDQERSWNKHSKFVPFKEYTPQMWTAFHKHKRSKRPFEKFYRNIRQGLHDKERANFYPRRESKPIGKWRVSG